MEEEYNPSGIVPDVDGNDVGTAENTENVSQTVSLKEIVKELTGREYKDDEDAAKGIAETYKFVTKKMEPTTQEQSPVTSQSDPEIVSKVAALERQVQEANFYASNPDYNNEDAKALITAMGGNPAEVVQNEVFKKAFSAIKANAEIDKSQSVLHSNSRMSDVSSEYGADYQKAVEQGTPEAWTEFAIKHKGIPMPKV